MDYLLTWRFALSLGIFVGLALYSSWLYALVRSDRRKDRLHFSKVVGKLRAENRMLRADVEYLAECLQVDLSWEEPNPVEPPEADTVELPAVEPEPEGPTTDIAHPADTFARKEALLARHRTESGGRSVKDILAEAGVEPIKRRRW